MRNSLVIVIFCLFLSSLGAATRGTTQAELPLGTGIYDRLPDLGSDVFHQRNPQLTPFQPSRLQREQWITSDSLGLSSILPAGEHLGTQYFSAGDDFIPYRSFGELLPAAISAVAKAPVWIRPRLELSLASLATDRQQIFADLINNAVDPYVDEIAFSVAVSSPQYLNSAFAWPELFSLNAMHIYSSAAALPYVQIIDSGISSVSLGSTIYQ